ncbi:esterase-like activity of phytase family protein [Acinetobacter apis]|uniref:Uncharacterized conserved protein n=1 Tax=Acinetobacter apis TaxID=1229165 RepID=A0A217EF08_9GAMM|nr:esterase-like activity of phytase family protein [Acinetobacter apis]SNQ28786.1 Uncharacterized conserved protein [Acinetobacter apis]
MKNHISILIGLLASTAFTTSVLAKSIDKIEQPTLVSFAKLPANTFAAGPISGTKIEEKNNIRPPFKSQPVQGFSAALKNKDGSYLLMPDNGYGTQDNSADFLLRIYRVKPEFRTKTQAHSEIKVLDFIQLRDPNRLIPFGITQGQTEARLLTGADFDPESIQRVADGSFWIGDEFGPYLLHFSAEGILLDPPFSLPDPTHNNSPLRSPQNQLNRTAQNPVTPQVQRSGGFEGMALSPNQRYLYPILEKPLTTSTKNQLMIFQFDLVKKQYTPNYYFFELDKNATNIGDFQMFSHKDGIIIERDANQGEKSAYKKLIQVKLKQKGQPVERKTLVDLLHIDNPHLLYSNHTAGDIGTTRDFKMPFETIESLIIESPKKLTLLNDNNYPFSTGRNPSEVDANEMIQIQLPRPLR